MKKIILITILFLLVGIVSISGCTDNTEKQYSVGSSNFKLQGDWEETYNVDAATMSRVKLEKGGTFIQVVKYNDNSQYDLDLTNSKENYLENNTNIEGIAVTVITTGTNKYLYYFKKGDGGYSVDVEGITELNALDYLNQIVNTLN